MVVLYPPAPVSSLFVLVLALVIVLGVALTEDVLHLICATPYDSVVFFVHHLVCFITGCEQGVDVKRLIDAQKHCGVRVGRRFDFFPDFAHRFEALLLFSLLPVDARPVEQVKHDSKHPHDVLHQSHHEHLLQGTRARLEYLSHLWFLQCTCGIG